MSSVKSDPGQEALDPPETNTETKGGAASHDREIDQTTTTPTGQTKCSICQSTFRRPEHLKRHFRSHTKEKPFECTQCGRHFSRTDTLHRHELSHHTTGTDGGKDRTHRITVKTFRACFKCAVARVRCSGGAPCSRCENRSLDCQYPTERRSKAKLQKSRAQNSSPEKEDASFGRSSHSFSAVPTVCAEVYHTKAGESPSSQLPRFEVGQFQLQIPELKQTTSSSNASAELSSQERSNNQLDYNGRASLSSASGSSLLRPAANGVTDATPRSFAFNGVNEQFYSHSPGFRIQNTLAADHVPRSSQPDIEASGNNIHDIAAGGNQQLQLAFSQSFIDHSTLSTINWLSNDLFLDPAHGQGPVSGPSSHHFQPGGLDNSLARTSWLPPVINTEHISSSLSGNISHTPSGTTSLGGGRESPGHFPRDVYQVSHTHLDSAKRRSVSVDNLNRRPPKEPQIQTSWHLQSTCSINTLLPTDDNNTQPRYTFLMPREFKLNSIPETSVNFQIRSSTYDQIYSSFVRLCCTENFLYPKFESRDFPSAKILSALVKLFFNSFQSVYPIFHTPTFDPNACHWLVAVALAAIGSHYVGSRPLNGIASAFHEFLRRAIFVEKESRRSEPMPLWLLQTIMLNCIGILNGNDERGRVSALSEFGDLVNLATRERLLCRPDRSRAISNETSPELQWNAWVEEESRRRTGYLIWLVDCTISYQFDNKPLLSLDDGQAPLPSHETIWQAQSTQAWIELRGEAPGSEGVSLYDAILIMYIEKGLVPEIGNFSHILLIHALYHRMWEVGDYFRRPLSFWNPTAKKQSRHLAIPSGSVWLPGIPSYSKWRNSACDCLDILHWTADSTVSKANGHEHATILHLHTARIVLLAPFREIRSLATLLATEKANWSSRQQIIEWHYILRWIKHDQYKARLAVIHAGSVLCHVRKYSANAFHEPVAAFLAILTLWAYGMCYTQASIDTNSRAGSQRNPSSELSVIHLDQPCDDELVQLFVREGHNMKGILTGVGDVCAPRGPEGILRAGCDIIGGRKSWGISEGYIAILKNLADAVSS